jgi:peptidoglycan/xylan/chitin deacetylase (PgdA/CDA1 family)
MNSRTIKRALRAQLALAGKFALPRRVVPRILCYHQVTPEPIDEWGITPRQMAEHVQCIRDQGHAIVPLGRIVDWCLRGTELPENAVALTFDDGFLDVLRHAEPVLTKLNAPATMFVPSDRIDDPSAESSFDARCEFMSWSDVRTLRSAGWTIGSHAASHRPLASLPANESERELRESRRRLEDQLGEPCALLAYPFGTPGTVSPREHLFAKEAGYEAAMAATTARLERTSPQFALPRSKLLGDDHIDVLIATLQGKMDLWGIVERSH